MRVSADEQGGKTSLVYLALRERTKRGDQHSRLSLSHFPPIQDEKKAKVTTANLLKNLKFYMLHPVLIFLSASFVLFNSGIASHTVGFGL